MEMTQNTSPAEPMDDSIQIKDLLYHFHLARQR